jgi:hypothetical protein
MSPKTEYEAEQLRIALQARLFPVQPVATARETESYLVSGVLNFWGLDMSQESDRD